MSSLTTMGSSTTYSSSDKQYNLRWHDYHQSVVSSFRNLKDEEDFVDVTLACNTQQFTAHKVVLSACSPYFRRLLKSNPCQHPIVILRDVTEDDLRSLLKFMYNGEVQIAEERLKDFLRTAETLQVRGLSDGEGEEQGQQCQKTSSTSAISTTMDHDGVADYSGPLAKRHRGMNGGSSISSPMPSSPAGSNNNEQQENNNLTKESLLSQALEKPPLRIPEEDSAFDAMSDRPEMDKSDSNMGLSSPAVGAPNNFFPPGLEALYRQAGFPAFMGLGGPPGGGSNHGMQIPGLATSVPSVGLQSHANNPTIGGKLDMMRVRATDPRPCPKCGKIYRSAHTLRTHMEDKHTICPGYRCVLCGTVAKSRNSLHSHMSRQHRGISTKDLPVVPMPAPFDAELASRLLAKAGVKVSPSELAARASPTAPRRSDLPKLDSNFLQSQGHHQFPLPPSMPVGGGSDPEDLRIPTSSPFSTASGGIMTASAAQHMARSLNPKDFAMSAAGAAAAAAGGMGSTLLDTYLSMIAAAGGDSNMAAAALNLQSGRAAAFAAAAAAASGDRTNGDNKSDIAEDDGGELGSDAENDLSDNEESKQGGDN